MHVTKYLKSGHPLQTLTLALCWLFRKRSFVVSGDFHDVIYVITTGRSRLVQTYLLGNEIGLKVVWVFIGIFPASKLQIDRNEWCKVITDKEILSKILS